MLAFALMHPPVMINVGQGVIFSREDERESCQFISSHYDVTVDEAKDCISSSYSAQSSKKLQLN